MAWNPENVRFPSGPNCDGCPFRATSRGFLVPQGYTYIYTENGDWLRYEAGPLWTTADFLFLAEGGGKDEAQQGMNLVGGTGGIYNFLIHNYTPLKRVNVAITNTVKCRPIVHSQCPKCKGKDSQSCPKCKGMGIIPVRQSNKDYVNAKPSSAQIEECSKRYLNSDLEKFNGHTQVWMGAVALEAMAGKGKSMKENQGLIFEHGSMVPCEECKGEGHLPRPRRKCPRCKDKKVEKCAGCGRFGKHTKKCPAPLTVECIECLGVGTFERPPKVCPGCKGNKELPADPGNPYVTTRLKPGQVALVTYHPAYLMRKPDYKRMLQRDFSRITRLRDELVVEKTSTYFPHPTTEQLDRAFEGTVGSIDLETNALWEFAGDIEMVGFTNKVGTAVVAPGESQHAYEWLKRASEDPSITVVGQNWMQFDAWWIYKKWGILPPLRCWDTRLAGHLHNPDTPNNLVYLTREYARPPIRGYWKTKQHYRDDKRQVAAIDVDATLRTYHGQHEELSREGLVDQYWSEVYPVMRVAFNMRRNGWPVLVDKLQTAHDRIETQLQERRLSLPEWDPKPDGTRSEGQHEQVKKYLYEKLKLPIQLDHKTHQPSSGWEQRQELKNRIKTGHESTEHLSSPEAATALDFLDLIDGLQDDAKLLTFLNPESKFLDGDRFHATWNPTGTATYRFSCADPNLQQIPKCGCKPKCYGLSPTCRGARFPFVAGPKGWSILTADFSQIEVIGFLWSAGQWDILKQCLFGGLDAHDVMAKALGMPRDDAKHMTFALVYGAEDRTIAAKSGKSMAQVAEARAHYLKVFPGVREFRWRYIQFAMKYGYVENAFGRRRYLWVRSPVGRAANQAANAPIQGIPPMVVRRAMIRLDAELPEPAYILGNIHDELVIATPDELLPQVAKLLYDVMKAPVPELEASALGMHQGLIFNVEMKAGPNWAACQGYKL